MAAWPLLAKLWLLLLFERKLCRQDLRLIVPTLLGNDPLRFPKRFDKGLVWTKSQTPLRMDCETARRAPA
jgi:hypothetical protein